MSVYLYRPPSFRMVQTVEGSLRYGVTTPTIVYRQGGSWHNQSTAGMSDPEVSACDVWVDPSDSSNTLRLFFSKPMVVPGDLHDELAAIIPADPSWTAGSLTLL